MTTAEAAVVLNRFAGHVVMIDRVDVGDDPDCVVVTLRPVARKREFTRHLAISVGECAGLIIEELKPGHPILLRIAKRGRMATLPRFTTRTPPDGPKGAA